MRRWFGGRGLRKSGVKKKGFCLSPSKEENSIGLILPKERTKKGGQLKKPDT